MECTCESRGQENCRAQHQRRAAPGERYLRKNEEYKRLTQEHAAMKALLKEILCDSGDDGETFLTVWPQNTLALRRQIQTRLVELLTKIGA